MARDYSQFTDFWVVAKDAAVLREYPEPDALALVTLKKGQLLRRLDSVNWNGAWFFLYADVVGGRKYEGYLHFEDVSQTDGPLEPAKPQQPEPQPPPAPPPPPPPPTGPAPMVTLGCVDSTITDDQCRAYLGVVERTTRLQLAQVENGLDKVAPKRLPPLPAGAMTISQVQQALNTLGFFPGGEADGIYGYRTLSAVRLFQEYVRSIEKKECLPDGRFGPQTQAHLERWLAAGAKPNWGGAQGEYEAWLGLLEAARQKYLAQPPRVIQKVNEFTGNCDTRKPAQWDFTGPGAIHLVGIRRKEATNKFDDVFALLIKGMVFKFQGSTEPGASNNPAGPPHLVPGQHDYHFGWHQRKYLALRPRGAGVLVVRAGADKILDDADVERGLEANPTINIHWGGRGMGRDVNSWSEGCQVINGTVYMNPSHDMVSCAAFAAVRPDEPRQQVEKTRGAYNVLVDLVTALSGDMPNGNMVRYTLLMEQDLDLAPQIKTHLDDARAKLLKMGG
jgi:hypothetical protein